MTTELNRRTMLGMLAAGSAAWAVKQSAAADPKGSAGKILMPIGDATEAVDTLYLFFRVQEDGYEAVVVVLRPACITWSCTEDFECVRHKHHVGTVLAAFRDVDQVEIPSGKRRSELRKCGIGPVAVGPGRDDPAFCFRVLGETLKKQRV